VETKVESLLKKGDRVALGDISKSVQGTIMEVFNDVYKVRWDNYRIGYCSAEDLTLIENEFSL